MRFLLAMMTSVTLVMTPVASFPQSSSSTSSSGKELEDADSSADDAARDLKEGSFYNRPGATRAEYNAEWQTCRLIARGGTTPSAGMGILGAALEHAIEEGRARRANRRQCLMLKGWRVVRLSAAEKNRIAALSEQARASYFDSVIGASEPVGDILAWRNDLAEVPALVGGFDFAKPAPSGNSNRLTIPAMLAPGQGAIVVGFWRPDRLSLGKSGKVAFSRYDVEHRSLVSEPTSATKYDEGQTYSVKLASSDKTLAHEFVFQPVSAGDYVLTGVAPGPLNMVLGAFCFGAPTFHVNAGEVVYVGDFTPYMGAKTPAGQRIFAMAYSSHPEAARAFLAPQPELLAALKPAALQNATYGCQGTGMTAYFIRGIPSLEAP